jgi:hypothetical protein
VSPVKYELGFYIREDSVLNRYTHSPIKNAAPPPRPPQVDRRSVFLVLVNLDDSISEVTSSDQPNGLYVSVNTTLA